ncbi:hypothetical protein [Devosia sp.]|uniref:hypothetical protein n=1 Tax=Devosia sp. TaxID=1871048 RepID=UPI003A924927
MSAPLLTQSGRWRRIVQYDLRNIVRDPMLLIVMVMSALPALGLAIWRSDIDAAALGAFDAAGFTRYLIPTFLVLPALLIGWVVGFLTLEDRDEGALMAVAITPLGARAYLGYRAALAAGLTMGLTIYGILLLLPGISFPLATLISVLVAIEAVLSAAILPAMARNKVEGLALTKLTNILAMAPLAALLPFPWRYAFGIVPHYWLGELLLVPPAEAMPLWITAALALAVHAIVVAGLLRRIRR